MIIRSLKLQNCRKHRDAFMEFPDGLFGIVGNNEAGKTSIIEAIAWSIYGAHACKTGQELLKTEGISPDSDCRAELEFSLGSDSYKVVRELRGSRQAAYAAVYVNNSTRPEVEGTHPVTRYLANKIGMDYASFFTSVFAKQKELDALSDLQPGVRKKRILRLLRIDRIDAAVDHVRKDKKETEFKIVAIRGTVQDIDVLSTSLAGLRKQKGNDSDAVETVQATIKESKASLAKVKKAKDTLERKHSSYRDLMGQQKVQDTKKALNEKNLKAQESDLRELETAKEELSQIKSELRPYKSTKVKKERLDWLREKYLAKNGLQERLSEIKQKIKDLKRDRKNALSKIAKGKNLDSKLAKIETVMEKFQAQSSTLDKKIAGKRASIQEYKKQKVKLSTQFEEIKEFGPESKCPICSKTIGEDLLEMVEHFKKEIAKASNRIKTQSELIEKLLERRMKADRLLKDAKLERNRLNNLIRQRAIEEQEKNSLDRQIVSEVQQLKKISGEIRDIGAVAYYEEDHDEVKKLFRELEQLDKKRIALSGQVLRIPTVKKSIRSLRSGLASIAKRTGKISDSIGTLGFREDEYEQAKEDYGAADAKYHKKREDLINAKNALANTSKEIVNAIRQIAEEKRKGRQIEKEEKKIEILNSLDRIFGEFRLELISRIRPLLSLRASELFRKLTDGKYPSISLDENYDMFIEDGGKRFPLERFSGGEEDLASLCLRIAISQVIEERSGGTGIDFVVLDEIFGSQDENRKSNILKALNDLSSQFRQIVVITHVEEIKDVLPYVFNVIETADKSSKIIVEGNPSMALSA